MSRRTVDWPRGVNSAVMLTFDLDAETLWTSRNPDNWDSPGTLSQGAYGPRVGLPRLLDMLQSEDVQATFFVPGWVAEQYPDVVGEIDARGHEIAYHGYLHEFDPPPTLGEERKNIERCREVFERLIGRRPRGYRPPMNELRPETIRLVLEQGFEYASCMMDDDVPYFHELDGEPTPLLQFPTAWLFDDSSFFFFTLTHPVRRGISTNGQVLEIWREEFDALHREGSSLVLIIHPQISGRPSRVDMLRDLVRHIKRTDGAWLARCCDVSDAFRDGRASVRE